jgi:hypothetical protein
LTELVLTKIAMEFFINSASLINAMVRNVR